MISRSVWAILAVLFFFGFSLAAIAGAGWTDFAPVAELRPTSQVRYVVRLKVSENPSGCRTEEFFFQDYTASGSRQMFRALLSAVEHRKDVRVYVTGRCNLDGYSEISAVSIVP
ncbi:MAG: hypothetical protein JSU95_02165 [Betaproteobacteria bacterium]|nr:MAG: hypothetical protein JSU95_02165 [Betaproteobacteria bacterium]